MTLEEIKTKVKTALRTSTTDTALVGEIGDCVDECIEDLKRAGVPTLTTGEINLDDPLVLKACKMFAKSEYGYDEDSDKYKACYEQIKMQLCLYSGYSA